MAQNRGGEKSRLCLRLSSLAFLCFFFLLLGGGMGRGSGAAEVPARVPGKPVQEEQFLQHFIRRSLQGETPSPPPVPAPQRPPESPPPDAPPESSPPLFSPSLTEGVMGVALKMVLFLSGLLGLLLVLAYLVRRYFLHTTLLSQRGPLIRVVARTYIAPKKTIALVQVPGKVLVVGITGHTMTALGELAEEQVAALSKGESQREAKKAQAEKDPSSFRDALDQQVQEYRATPMSPEEEATAITETIQRKVRDLKRL